MHSLILCLWACHPLKYIVCLDEYKPGVCKLQADQPLTLAGPQPVGCPFLHQAPWRYTCTSTLQPACPSSVYTHTHCLSDTLRQDICIYNAVIFLGDSPKKKPRQHPRSRQDLFGYRTLESWYPVCNLEEKQGLRLNRSLWPCILLTLQVND